MSVIMDHSPDRLAKVFFGCSLSDIKKTVVLTLGIRWLFGKIAKRKFVVKRSRGWWNFAIIKCDDSYATVIAAGCGSSEVTDIVRLLTKWSFASRVNPLHNLRNNLRGLKILRLC